MIDYNPFILTVWLHESDVIVTDIGDIYVKITYMV